MKTSAHKAIYPGSFDPPTLGHMDVLARARRIFDEIVVAVGCNPDKTAFFEAGKRVEMMTRLVEELVGASAEGAPVTVAFYDGLTVDFAREIDATVILRGIRNTTDLHAECQLAITNRQVADIETVFVVPGETFAYTSSGLIRQIASLGGDLNRLRGMLPALVIDAIAQRRSTSPSD